jgi:hypothetical protein
MQGWRLGRLMEEGVSIEDGVGVVVVEDCIMRHIWMGHYRSACCVYRLHHFTGVLLRE